MKIKTVDKGRENSVLPLSLSTAELIHGDEIDGRRIDEYAYALHGNRVVRADLPILYIFQKLILTCHKELHIIKKIIELDSYIRVIRFLIRVSQIRGNRFYIIGDLKTNGVLRNGLIR